MRHLSRKSHFPKIRPAARPPQPPHRMVLPNSATTKQAKHYNCQPLHLHCSPHPVLLDWFSIPLWTVARHALLGRILWVFRAKKRSNILFSLGFIQYIWLLYLNYPQMTNKCPVSCSIFPESYPVCCRSIALSWISINTATRRLTYLFVSHCGWRGGRGGGRGADFQIPRCPRLGMGIAASGNVPGT